MATASAPEPRTPPVLHLICGKIASGKSTLARHLAEAPATVRLSEDEWLAALFSEQMRTGADYLRCAALLRGAIGPHVVGLLRAGVSVVMDFPANTEEQRAWMARLLEDSGAAHRMHVIEAPDDLCLARLKARNAGGAHPFAATEAQFRRFTKHYAPPKPEEGFRLVVHTALP
ncbi:hypothetical protein PSA7680_00303 [Pseudoruegeria aquimaris]|uniref:Zeta toxin n=1 Tax=Pseudoruegeria aquimaris TaxID=393663 RepID=A0A1Y5RCZ3_9RHOB|nr:ATP-binding protein [Pseudoruegeria aquimaris]SLN14222.1 hypothetical protein PSA7680_00303 [Pseudoruegeria aquimaris]